MTIEEMLIKLQEIELHIADAEAMLNSASRKVEKMRLKLERELHGIQTNGQSVKEGQS